MADPLFWLALSLLLVAVSLTAVLAVAIPAMRELGRAARSAEKLFDTLGRELPPTLEAIRLTGLEITELTDDVTTGVQSAGRVVKQVDQSLSSARQQTKTFQTGTQSLVAGARAAWRTWLGQPPATSKALAAKTSASSPRHRSRAQRPESAEILPKASTSSAAPPASGQDDRPTPPAQPRQSRLPASDRPPVVSPEAADPADWMVSASLDADSATAPQPPEPPGDGNLSLPVEETASSGAETDLSLKTDPWL